MKLKNIILTSLAFSPLTPLVLNTNAQQILNEDLQRRVRGGIVNTQVPPTSTTQTREQPSAQTQERSSVMVTTPESYKSLEETLHPQKPTQIVDAGTMRVSEELSYFSLKVSDPDKNMLYDPLPAFHNGKIIGHVHYNESDELWEYQGISPTSFNVGTNFVNIYFPDRSGAETSVAVKFTSTNEKPIAKTLLYDLESTVDGENINLELQPEMSREGQANYSVGDFSVKYKVANLEITIFDEDKNLLTSNVPVMHKNDQIGEYVFQNMDEEGNYTFRFQGTLPEAFQPGTHLFRSTFKDYAGAELPVNAYTTFTNEPPKVEEIHIGLGQEPVQIIDVQKQPQEQPRRSLFRRN